MVTNLIEVKIVKDNFLKVLNKVLGWHQYMSLEVKT
jgi:hypothetical protein